MGDGVGGGYNPGRARSGARGDYATEGVAKAAQQFLDDLSARMQRMDKPPQASFRHSYGGEFEVRGRLEGIALAARGWTHDGRGAARPGYWMWSIQLLVPFGLSIFFLLVY